MEDESGLDSPSEEKWITFAELADELCPQYMSIGVPYKEYWHGDYTQLDHYRRAFEMQRDRANYDAWLQGGYIYDALCFVAPILRAFPARNARPTPYHKEPYGAKQKVEKTSGNTEAAVGAAKFHAFASQFNKKFAEKSGETNGGND